MKPRTLLVVLLSISLTSGCGHWKKTKAEKEQEKAAKQQAKANKAQQKADKAQKPDQSKPDKFEASEDPPIKADTHFAAGQLAESQGDAPRAIEQYEAALKLDPKHRNALFRLGAIYTGVQKYDKAIAAWQQYLKATDNAPAAYNNLGLCYEQAGKISEAEEAFKAGIARDDKDPPCRINYGLMLARQNRLDDAIVQLQTVLSPAELHYNLGSVFEQQGKREQAKAYYQKALEFDPNLHDAKSRLAEMK